jgi:hypothetical protein
MTSLKKKSLVTLFFFDNSIVTTMKKKKKKKKKKDLNHDFPFEGDNVILLKYKILDFCHTFNVHLFFLL